jgi:hypothetical protein
MTNWPLQHATLRALLLTVTALLCFGTPGRAQSTAAQDSQDNRAVADRSPTPSELADFHQFLDSHPEIAEQIRTDPSLVDNREFVDGHPALRAYLRDNPGVREQLTRDPNAFMRNEDHFNRMADARNPDASRRDLVEFDRFLDSHPEIAEQLRKDPSLADNREFVRNHPALQAYLQDNPAIRDRLRQDPNSFMHQEDRFDLVADGRDRDASRDHMASFGRFLGGHSEIAQDVSKNPSLVKNREYVENHTELNEYLIAHPDVRNEWAANPQGFVKGAQQFSNVGGNTTGGSAGSGTTTTGGTGTNGGGSSRWSNPNPAPAQTNKPKQ